MREDITENSLKTLNLFIKKKHKCALNLKKMTKKCMYLYLCYVVHNGLIFIWL